jgi:hypothetical protein
MDCFLQHENDFNIEINVITMIERLYPLFHTKTRPNVIFFQNYNFLYRNEESFLFTKMHQTETLNNW